MKALFERFDRLRLLAQDAQGNGAARIVAIGVRDVAATLRRDDLPQGARVIGDPAGLAGLDADLVVEAAGRDSVGPWGRAALDAGMDFALSSTSALADGALLADLRARAARSGGQLIVHPGALGGIAGDNAGRLPRWAGGLAAIGALGLPHHA